NTGVDNVRDVIINNIALAPARDRFKVFVIDEVHMLSTSAFNALLKTLEEPPAHVIFILATTELHKLPDTILSRCQQFEFRQIPTEKIFNRLREIATAESVTIGESALREIARAGAGSLRDAQSAFDQVIAFSGNSISEEDVTSSLGLVSAATLARFAEAIARQETAILFELVEEIFARGYDARHFTRELMACFRHMLFIRAGVEQAEILGVTDVEITRLRELAPLFSEADLVRCFHLLAELEKEIKDSPQPRYQLELGLVGLAQVRRLIQLDELINRLETLEKRLDGGGAGTASEGQRSGGGGAPRPSGNPSPASATGPSAPPRLSTERAIPEREPLAPPPPLNRLGQNSVTEAPPPPPPVRTSLGIEPESVRPATARSIEEPFFDSEPLDLDPDDSFAPDPRIDRPAPPAPPPLKVRSAATPVSPGHGQEIQAIIGELQRLNRGLIETALDEARLEYQDGLLIATFGADDTFAKRIRESGELFRTIGEKALGRPLRVEVRVSGEVKKVVNEREAERERLRQRALQNPVVKQVLEQTRGEILWVREQGK
ncbi:MAG: DNA polymerase III subunit gamma/tau, partial [Acidobacteriota bacterium]